MRKYLLGWMLLATMGFGASQASGLLSDDSFFNSSFCKQYGCTLVSKKDSYVQGKYVGKDYFYKVRGSDAEYQVFRGKGDIIGLLSVNTNNVSFSEVNKIYDFLSWGISGLPLGKKLMPTCVEPTLNSDRATYTANVFQGRRTRITCAYYSDSNEKYHFDAFAVAP